MSGRRAALVAGMGGGLFLLATLWLSSEDSEVTAQTKTKEKHGGNIVFEVKENRQKLPHVLFSHELHLGAGHECKDCHNDTVFLSKRRLGINSFTMKDILRGKACGACHNGQTEVKGQAVFRPKGNCERCHNMKWRRRVR